MNEVLAHLGRQGLLDKWQLACAYAYQVYLDTGELPPAKSIPNAVKKEYQMPGAKMSLRTAYTALNMLKQTLPREK